jgi:glycosyltransferase involved in cell wall biosynthesis
VTSLVVGTGVVSLAALRRVLRGSAPAGGPVVEPPAGSLIVEPAGAAVVRPGGLPMVELAGAPVAGPAGVDVVHAHGLRAGLASALARSGGTPLVLSWSEAAPSAGAVGLVGRALTRTFIAAAAVVLAATADLAQAATSLGAGQVRHTPPVRPEPSPAVRTPEQVREELALPAGPIVLAHGRLLDQTRLDVLVDAAAGWRRTDAAAQAPPQVVLVGVGPAYRNLVARAMVARAPVTFAGDRAAPDPRSADGTGRDPDGMRPEATHGGVGEERAGLADLLAAATVAVVTDTRARPEFALRAALAGVPLVVPEGGTVERLLGGDPVAGPAVVAVPAGDVGALDAAVRALLDDPAGRAGLAAAARERVAGWPDIATAAGDLAVIYEQVARVTADGPVAGPADQVDTPGGRW